MPRTVNCAACVLVGFLASGVASHAQSVIEYRTVAEAKAALLAKQGVKSELQNGWLIVDEGKNGIWSFAPEGHEAHPAVGKRVPFKGEDGRFRMRTLILCEASKEACERLAQSYVALDEAMMKAVTEEMKKDP